MNYDKDIKNPSTIHLLNKILSLNMSLEKEFAVSMVLEGYKSMIQDQGHF